MNSEIDVLIINAHPDDCEMAMGGTLLKFTKAGFKVLNLSLTAGQSGTFGNVEIRKEEFTAAGKYSGAETEMWEYPDTRLEKSLEIVERVAKIIRVRKPKIVFAPYLRNDRASFHGMANKDHSVAGQIASEACKLARFKNAFSDSSSHTVSKLFFYMIPSTVFPQLLVDISDTVSEYKELVSCYKTQLQIPNIFEILLASKIQHASEAKISYAEAFVTEMPLIITPENIFNL